MKKSFLIGLLALIAGISIIVSASRDVSTYATFKSAMLNSGTVKIAGEIDKSEEIHYDPQNSPNSFSFLMKDSDGKSMKVIIKKPKPQDFEMSETVVVTGKMQEDIFVAHDVLLKCPSKYKDEELKLREGTSLASWTIT